MGDDTIAMTALALALAISAQQQATEPYRAHGTKPFWSLTIGNGRLRYEPAEGPPIDIPAPPQRSDQTSREYRSGRLSVSIFPGTACSDGTSDAHYADTIWVHLGEQEMRGCGGAALAPDDLTGTSWHFAEVAGEAVPLTGDLLRDDAYVIDFGADGFMGYGGCNRFSAAYSRSGDMLTAHAPWGSTVRRCADPVGSRERRLLQILTAPVRISLPDPNTLVLTGEHGTIRLQRTPEPRH